MSREIPNEVETTGSFDDDVEVVVIIPTYNERDNVERMCFSLLGLEGLKLGVLFVDDASPDSTGKLADGLSRNSPGRVVVVHRAGKMGLGTAYVAGFAVAMRSNATRFVQMDCDFSHPPEEVPAMLEALDRADVAMGTRYSHGGYVDPDWPLARVLLSKWANFGIRFILGLKSHDVTGGFKAYRRAALESIVRDRFEISGFGFQAEVAYRTQRLKLKVAEHPYLFKERTEGKSKMSLGIAIEAFWRLMLLRIKP